jgi:hypothetical protein
MRALSTILPPAGEVSAQPTEGEALPALLLPPSAFGRLPHRGKI